jgi:hypothetical protein
LAKLRSLASSASRPWPDDGAGNRTALARNVRVRKDGSKPPNAHCYVTESRQQAETSDMPSVGKEGAGVNAQNSDN